MYFLRALAPLFLCVICSSYTKAATFISLKDAGIVGDGKTDVTVRFQEVINKYDSIFIPAGNYVISSSIALRSNQVIYGTTHTTILEKSDLNNDFDFLVAKYRENIRVRMIEFKAIATVNKVACALRIFNCRSVSVSRIKGENCSILVSKVPDEVQKYSEMKSYQKNNLQSGSTEITVDNCIGTGHSNTISKRSFGVSLEYVNKWKVSNTTLKNYQHGVQWWGGDSNPLRDGNIKNARKCSDGKIVNVTVSNIGGGGIWGSMGENISVTNCHISNCKDVGIDFEGCFNCVATRNTVTNCNNGCLATFHFNQKIVFDKNIVGQSNPDYPLACIYNSSQSQDNGLILFSNNTFTATNGIGLIRQQGPSREIIFDNNKLINVLVNFTFNNNKIVSIKNNAIKITKPVNKYDFIIKAGETNNNGVVTIADNLVECTIRQPENVSVISIYQADYNSSPTNKIQGNRVAGIAYNIKVDWAGTNAGVSSKTFIYTNDVLGKKINKIFYDKGRSQVFLNDKKLQ